MLLEFSFILQFLITVFHNRHFPLSTPLCTHNPSKQFYPPSLVKIQIYFLVPSFFYFFCLLSTSGTLSLSRTYPRSLSVFLPVKSVLLSSPPFPPVKGVFTDHIYSFWLLLDRTSLISFSKKCLPPDRRDLRSLPFGYLPLTLSSSPSIHPSSIVDSTILLFESTVCITSKWIFKVRRIPWLELLS